MAQIPLPRPPAFIMETLNCYLQTGKLTADKIKKISILQMEYFKKCAAEEAKMLEEIIKTLK
jgi:hypothetical protein